MENILLLLPMIGVVAGLIIIFGVALDVDAADIFIVLSLGILYVCLVFAVATGGTQ